MKPLAVKTHFLTRQVQLNLAKNKDDLRAGLLAQIACLGILTNIALTGCDKVKPFALASNASSPASTTASTASAVNPSTDHTQRQATPVVYPINEWQQQSLVTKVSLNDTDAIKALLGEPVTVDNQSLDYHSNIATKYSFAKVAEPYFDLIDSSTYLELQWYYANANDNATIKNISINHAKKAFMLTQNWFGQNGSDIVANMLQGQPIKDKTYHGILVALARCENYHCNLVVKKNVVPKATKKRS